MSNALPQRCCHRTGRAKVQIDGNADNCTERRSMRSDITAVAVRPSEGPGPRFAIYGKAVLLTRASRRIADPRSMVIEWELPRSDGAFARCEYRKDRKSTRLNSSH